MKKNKKAIIIIVILLVLVIVGVIIKNINRIKLFNFEYDIIVEEHRSEYENANPMDLSAGGYSTKYYYTVINSKKKEKYTVIYEDVFKVHNEKGNVDEISIEITSLTDNEVKEAIDNYGLNSTKGKLRNLLNKTIDEKYKINNIEKK